MKQFLKKLATFGGKTNTVRSAVTVGVILVVIVLNAVLYTLTSMFGLYIYEPYEMDFSLSENAEEVLGGLSAEDGVEIIFCMPKEELKAHSTGAYLYKTVEKLEERFSDILSFRFINIITKVDEDGKYFDVTPFTKDETGETLTILKTSVIFRSGENFRVLTSNAYDDFFVLDGNSEPVAYCGEEVFLSMALWVTREEHPTAYFTTSHSELSDTTFARALAAAGYKIGTVNLRREDIPDDCALLIISSPQSDFERSAEDSGVVSEMDRLYEYAETGGNLYVTLDPYLKTPLPVLEGFLREYGIEISKSEIEGVEYANVIKDDAQGITTDGYTLVGRFGEDAIASKIADRVREVHDGNVLLFRAAALSLSDSATPLLFSSSSSELYASGERVDAEGDYILAASGKRTGENGENSQMFVCASIYLSASDAMLSNTYTNREFIYAIFDELYGAEGAKPYGTRAVMTESNLIEDLSMAEARVYTVLALLPAVIALGFGIVILTKRKYS